MSLYKGVHKLLLQFQKFAAVLLSRYFRLICFIVKGNVSSLHRCFRYFYMIVQHQLHVRYPIDIQFLALFLLIHNNCVKCFNYSLLQITDVSDFGSVNDIFYIAPQQKIQWCDVKGMWRSWNGTITSNPSSWKCVSQKLTNCKTPMRGCIVLLENN